jgi:hypothetical protein
MGEEPGVPPHAAVSEATEERSELAESRALSGRGIPGRSEGDKERHRDTRRRRTVLVVGVLLAVLAIPLVIALVVLHSPRWYPLLDMAQTEIRVRDVASLHPPLIGLAGRIGTYGANGGSHPGPLSFYALWPVWALLGGASYGMQVSDVVLDLIALGLALWIAYRRGGFALALGMTAALAVLTRAYGAFLLTLPWNPYLPVLWWVVFLLAVWSVVADDFAMLPVAVFAGTFCAQTHISYLGMVAGLVVVMIVVLALALHNRWADVDARRRVLKWTGASVVLGVVLWIPPVLDEIVHTPANITTIRRYFSSPPSPPIGLHNGLNVLLIQLNPWKLVSTILVSDTAPQPVSGSRLPGVLMLLAFAASVALAWWMRHRLLLRLDLVLGIALLFGLISAARIFDYVWYYLLLWSWGLVALMLVAIGWTIVALLRGRKELARPGLAVLLAIIVGFTTVFAVDAAHVDAQNPRLNATLGKLVSPTVAALHQREQQGLHGPYLVTIFPDAEAIGSAGFGMLNELLRRGFDAKTDFVNRPGATRYHVVANNSDATLQVHLATGPDIKCWANDSRFQQVAYYDPRSDADRAEFDQLHAQVVSDLEAAGHADLVNQVDTNLFTLVIANGVPVRTRDVIRRMLAIGMPAAVFIGPTVDVDHKPCGG